MRDLRKLLLLLAIASGLLCRPSALVAQTAKPMNNAAPQVALIDDPALKNALQKCLPLHVTTNVSDQASVEAVLIPAGVARRIFGKEVSQNYAVIEVIVSNKDSNAQLIVQSVFLDYSKWLLSGLSTSLPQLPTLEPTQKGNVPWQVASVESRLVRGELLDAQQWTGRNWTIRSLTAVGSVAAGFAFPFSADVAKGFSAYNGVFIPAASNLWPDATVTQINRISDFGFQTNKIIPKQASDILVAFFPIDRFLTPTFKGVFLANPSAFFVPGELLSDPKTPRKLHDVLVDMAMGIDGNVTKENLSTRMIQAFNADCSPQDFPRGKETTDSRSNTPECKLQRFFSGLSLNSVRVVVGGVMSVDVAKIPATIYEVDFNDGNKNADIWTTTGKERDGKILGVYLSGGTPSIVDSNGVAIDGIKIEGLTTGASDTQVPFKMTLSKCIPASTTVSFVVTKAPDTSATQKDSAGTSKASGESVKSTPFQFALPGYTCPESAQGANAQTPSAANPEVKKTTTPAPDKPGAPAQKPAAPARK